MFAQEALCGSIHFFNVKRFFDMPLDVGKERIGDERVQQVVSIQSLNSCTPGVEIRVHFPYFANLDVRSA